MLNIIIGRGWFNRAFILGTFGLYIYLSFFRTDVAKKGFTGAVNSFIHLFTLIFAGFLIAKAIGLLLPTSKIMAWFGQQAGIKGIFNGLIFGNLLGGPPASVYPVIKSILKKGASFPVIMAIFLGYDAIGGFSKLVFGSIFFEPKLLFLRYVIMIVMSIITSTVLYFVW